MSRRVKRLKETTKDRVLMWIKHCSDVNFGIWIECVECKKWRKSYKYCESHEVEENWRCSMNTWDGGKKGSCDDPEEGVLEDYLEYSPGSIVWAKLEGYPWWPAMVDVDPDVEEYFWSEKNTMFYHVTFLDNHVTRSWISSKCLSPFSRRPLNNKFQKKYFDAISKAEEKANTAIKMTLKERLAMFSFVHLYKGKWPLARDFDTDEEENAHNITDILLEEVDDLDSLNSFDSGMIENNALPEKNEPKRSPTVFQKKKVASSKSSNIHSDDESYKNSCNEPIKKQKSTSSKENPSNNFKMKNKLSLMKMKLLAKSPPSDILGDLGVSPNKTSNKIKGDVSTNTNAFSPSGSSKKTISEADNKCNLNSKSNCFDELLKELDEKRAEIPIPLDSEISYINISQRSQGISDLENTDNLGNSIEWVVNNFKIPQENEAVEKSKPVSNKKLKTPSSSFGNVSSHDNKENTSSMVPASVNKGKKSQKNESNEEKRTQNDTGSEKRKIPFKSVIPKNKEIEEKAQLKNSSSVKKPSFCSLIKTPVNSKINKRKESENLSISDENANNKRLKPSFQYKVKSSSSLQVKVKNANFKVPLSDTVKILTVPKIADKEEMVSKSNKIGNDNFDGDSDCDKVIKEKIYSQVDEDLKTKDSLNNLVFHKSNIENCTEEGTDFLLSKYETKSSKSANTVTGVSYGEDKSKNNGFSIKPKVFNKNNGENFTEEDADLSDFLLSKDETKSYESANTVTGVSDDEDNSKNKGSSIKPKVFHKNNTKKCIEEDTDMSDFLLSKDETKYFDSADTVTGVSVDEDKSKNNGSSMKPKVFHKNSIKNCTEEDTDMSDFLLSKDETKSFDSADTVTDVSNDEKNSKTNGIVSSETNNKDDCFFDILVSDDEC